MKKYLFLIYSLFCLGIITTNAQYTRLLSFNGVNGGFPYGSLTLSPSGTVLYGMTYEVGLGGQGNIFSIHTNGSGYTDLFDFGGGTNGSASYGSLTLLGNKLYGMTQAGGTNGDGNIFSIDTNGNGYTDLFDFGGTNGIYPSGSLTLSPLETKLYGMTQGGGTNSHGLVFSIDTDGNGYTVLLNFDGTNGSVPYYGSLTFSTSGRVLYGMTQRGGTNGYGNIFSIDTDGTSYNNLWNFADTNGTNGKYPTGSLTLSGKKLYGMTGVGGVNGNGLVFSIDTNGSGYKDLLNFDLNGANGSQPNADLTLSGNTLYGMTSAGGPIRGVLGVQSDGLIFSIDTNGSNYIDLFDFSPTNGITPMGDLTLSGSVLYGMTNIGGRYNDGAIFSIPDLGVAANLIANVTCNGNTNGIISAISTGGASPYTYSWSNNGTRLTQTGLTAGTYTITVADSNGYIASDSIIMSVRAQRNINGNLLCFATVDTTSSHNIIAWDTIGHSNEGIDSVSLFFYNASNTWQKIGEKSYLMADSNRYFVDTLNNPNAVTVRYCIKTTDSCGDTSNYSNWQNTMYISNSGTGTFSWSGTSYLIEGNSLPVLTYYLFRNDSLINSVSGTQNKITDVNYSNTATYWVGAKLSISTCSLSPIALGHRAELKSSITNLSHSNILNKKPTGIESIEKKTSFNVYPNPSNGNFKLELEKESDVGIYDVTGRLFFQSRMPQGTNLMNIDGSAGLYLLSVDGVFKKLIKD